MEFLKLLKESVNVLAKEPKVFAPRIATTIIYSAFIFMSTKLTYDVSLALALETAKASPNIASALNPYTKDMMLLFLASLACFASDILAYAMYPTIIADYVAKREIKLWNALENTLTQWKTLLVFSLTIILFLAFFLGFFSLAYASIIMSGKLILIPIASVVMILVFIAVSVIIFFIVPVSVVEKKGVSHSFRKSFRLGLKHKGPVVKTTLFSMGVALVTIFFAMASGFEGASAYLAFALFAVTRIIQAVSYTYLNVVNPYLYLALDEGED
ncbi:MAG: hypothetical protein ABH834_02750 [Candidatus Altiarchaeota archaeon]